MENNIYKENGNQPCEFIGSIQSTNCYEWQCPQCKEQYASSGSECYCEKCIEPIEEARVRLNGMISDRNEKLVNIKKLNAEIINLALSIKKREL